MRFTVSHSLRFPKGFPFSQSSSFYFSMFTMWLNLDKLLILQKDEQKMNVDFSNESLNLNNIFSMLRITYFHCYKIRR